MLADGVAAGASGMAYSERAPASGTTGLIGHLAVSVPHEKASFSHTMLP
jgi:hypothetical protein